MSITLTRWVIKDRATGKYLPPGMGFNGRGSTHQEVCDPEACLPKFFLEKKTAERCLQAWLRGIYEGDGGGEEGRYWSRITKMPNRIPENMEIVEATIILNP